AAVLRMIGRALRTWTTVVVGVALVAACGSVDRPASLSLDEVKPCELIPQPKREALKVSNGPILSETVGGVGLEGTTCKYYVKYEKPTENPVSKTTTTSVKL